MPFARQSAKTNPGMYSKGTKAKNAAEKKVHQDAVRAALAFTQFHGKSTVWAMKHGDFAASVTKNILDKALAGKLVYCNSDRREDSILTELEAERLITWIKGCAQNTNPAFDAEISQQVIKMLRVRWTFNKTKKHSKVAGCIPLTAAEMRLVRQEKAEVSRTWLTNFQARSGIIAKDGVGVGIKGVRNADVTRTKKQNEGVVEQHIYGEFGVQAELIDMGIMDPETKVRVLRALCPACVPACH
jgi:autotransporter adhesin